jgi:hypothetical protein
MTNFKNIETALTAIEQSKFPNVYFDEFAESGRYPNVSYSRGIGEVEGEEVDVTIYIDNETLEVVDILIEEVEK